MKNKNFISRQTVKHISALAKIPLTTDEEIRLTQGFNTTLEVIDHLNEIRDIFARDIFLSVTGLYNVFRDDKIDNRQTLSQEDALKNAKRTYQGYFMVKAIFGE